MRFLKEDADGDDAGEDDHANQQSNEWEIYDPPPQRAVRLNKFLHCPSDPADVGERVGLAIR